MTTDHSLARELAQLHPTNPEHLQRLRRRLALAAESDGTLDVAYRTVDTPVGPLLLAATDRGLVRVAYATEDHGAVLQSLAERISPRILHAPGRLDTATRQLDDYFAGRSRGFELTLDWRLSAGFRATVLHRLVDIEFGSTASYATMARLVGNPRGVRAVGSACASNPLPVVVPCHRVVRSDGGLGGYIGGPEIKQALLRLEGVV